MNKYGNKKITVDGKTFDSRREYKRFTELQLLERAGEISNLRMQVPFTLIPAQYEQYERYGKNGQRLTNGQKCVERECAYVADFVYIDNTTGKKVVEDTKGMRTKDYIIKRKLMLRVHGIKIKEV
jgi:hypothetical protein